MLVSENKNNNYVILFKMKKNLVQLKKFLDNLHLPRKKKEEVHSFQFMLLIDFATLITEVLNKI